MSEEILKHIHHFITPILTALVFYFLSKIAPSERSREYAQKYDEVYLEKLSNKYSWLSIIPLFVMIPFLTWLLGQFFNFTDNLFFQKPKDCLFFVRVESGWWNVIGLLLSIAFAFSLMRLFFRSAIGYEKAELLDIYTEIKYKINPEKVSKVWLILWLIPAIFVVFLMSDWYIKINADKLEFNEFKSFGSNFYNLKDIKKIDFTKEYKQGMFMKDAFYVVHFADNSFWDIQNGLNKTESLDSTMRFLSEKSKVKIDTVKAKK